jgi:DNA-binding CsgD family transcriptional regulator
MVVEQRVQAAPTLLAVTLARIVIVAVAVAAVAALLTARLDGVDSYLTHPVGALALAGAGAGIAALAGRRFALRDRTGGWWMLALAAAVVAYLALGAIATTTTLLVGLWSVWWAAPLVVVQLAALYAARTPWWWSVVFGSLGAVAISLGAIVARPPTPFVGLAPIAPEGWPASPVIDALIAVTFIATVVVPVLLVIRSDRSPTALLIAASAALPPLLIVVCTGLAIARDPGAVEPEIGSVGYLVALSTGCLIAALCLTLVRPVADVAVARRLIATIVGAYAVVLIALVATLLGGWLAPAGPLASGLAVAALAVAVAVGWWLVVGRLARPEQVPTATRLTMLSPREQQVLALLADGVRDADIAAQLHLSERTVESHLIRIFAKLGLEASVGRNRRVLAVRAWSEANYGKDRIPG